MLLALVKVPRNKLQPQGSTYDVIMYLEVFATNSTAASSGRSIFEDGWVIVAVAKGTNFAIGYPELHFGFSTCTLDDPVRFSCFKWKGGAFAQMEYENDYIRHGEAFLTDKMGRNADSEDNVEFEIWVDTLHPDLEA